MSRYDVIVIGGGGAGVMAACAASETGAKVAIVCKEPVGYGNTRMAVGLTACALLAGDTREAFIEDILTSGEGLCNPELVTALVDGSREALAFLEQAGHMFARSEEGELSGAAISRAGGHTRSRTLLSSGAGVGMALALRNATDKYGMAVYEDCVAYELIKDGDIVVGAKLYDLAAGGERVLFAGATILATGGGGWLFYPQTSNNRGSAGDGYALAFRAGAELQDMEQIQALPFSVTHPAAYRGLICGEPAVAGPAGRLINSRGEIVLEKGIQKMNRAAVVREMATHIARGDVAAHGGLWLDLRPNLALENGREFRDRIRSTGISDTVLPAYGKKAFDWEEPWEVLPTAHYFMGGVKADKNGVTTVPGLFAAGEVTGGVHGGNRLGSVALTEILVFGLRAGRAAAAFATQRKAFSVSLAPGSRQTAQGGKNRPITLCKKLQKCMWESAGLVRNEESLKSALNTVQEIALAAADVSISSEKVYNTEYRDLIELGFMLDTAKLVLTSALLRQESRGAHLRSDFPANGGTRWEKNIVLWKNGVAIAHRMEGRGK